MDKEKLIIESKRARGKSLCAIFKIPGRGGITR